MFNFLSKIFRVKQQELEAKLLPTPHCTYGGIGEVEIETWSGGLVKLEATLKHSGLPDGATVVVYLGGRQLATLQVAGGYAKQFIDTEEPNAIPSINVGDVAEMKYNGQVVYRGQFRPD